MSWFGEQIQNRLRKDGQNVSDSLLRMADSISGAPRFHARESETDIIRTEVERICHYFELRIPEEIPDTKNVNDLIDYMVRPLGIMRRRVVLEDKWWKKGDGPLLAVIRENGEMCALIPGKLGGYRYYDRTSGKYVRVDSANRDRFDVNAVCFYRPLPEGEVESKELLKFLLTNMPLNDIILIVLSTLLITVLGVLTPLLTQIIFAQIIPADKYSVLHSTVALLVSAAVGTYLLNTVKTGVLSRVTNRMDTLLQNAVVGRLLNLPVKFFSDKSSGALSQSVGYLTVLPNILVNVFFNLGVTVAMSLIYVGQMAMLAPSMAIPALLTFVLEMVLIVWCIRQKTRIVTRQLAADEATQGLVFALFSAIQKIRLSGSENRVFSKWAEQYQKKVQSSYQQPFPSFMLSEMVIIIQMIGMIVAYTLAMRAGVTVAQFASYSTSIGLIMAVIQQFSASADLVAFMPPVLKTGETILRAIPETSTGKRIVEKLNGAVEMSHVTFSYEADGPKILNDMNLKINPGEYVAIVGKSGCGKSTLMRLLLGFETPNEGAIYYGNRDLSTLDMPSFRRNVGTVLQSGKLFAGDIFANITISAPWLKMDDAWEVARMAGMAEDIEDMPMGMRTMISEGSGGISGGQRQRLMIARAIAPKPSILMFDEATSALDNITQKIVADSLNNLQCTRIVIAHRLSTIKECDRIIVLDSGRIVEDGNYNELMARNGFFADLVSRQQVDIPTAG